MKCFKIFIAIFFVSFCAMADNYLVIPHDKTKATLKLGDIVYVEIINQDGQKKFQGEKVGGILHVLGNTNEDVYRTIVAPENPKNKKQTTDKFELRGFEFGKGVDNMTQNFETADIDYVVEASAKQKYYLILILLFLLPFLIKGFFQLAKKLEEKKKIKIKKAKLRKLILSAKTREELEKVYYYKKEIEEYLKIEESIFNLFKDDMNNIQYKKRWDEDDITRISKTVGEFKKDVSGV